jgi:hypothetical protein
MSTRAVRTTALLLVATTAALACRPVEIAHAPTTTKRPARIQARLVAFDACADAEAWIKSAALARVGPGGLVQAFAVGRTDSGVVFSNEGVATPLADAKAQAAAGADAAPYDAATSAPPTTAVGADPTAIGTDHGTNVQEVGVDEADTTKTDGHRIVAIRGASLEIVAMGDGSPRVEGAVDLGFVGQGLLLVGDRAIVYGSANTSPGGPIVPQAGSGQAIRSGTTIGSDIAVAPSAAPATTLAEVDLATRHVLSTRTVDGSVVAGRLLGSSARLVVSTTGLPRIGFVMPQTPRGSDEATAVNRAAIERSSYADWVPLEHGPDGTTRPLVPCDQLMRPAAFSGFGVTTVITIPNDLDHLTSTAVMADAGVVYASASHLYVTTTSYTDPSAPTTVPGSTRQSSAGPVIGGPARVLSPLTDIHRFDIGAPDVARYEGSGRIDGTVHDQYSLSESGDVLRIATTRADQTAMTQSGLSVLTLRDGRLVEIGRLDGLGPSEQIRAVRFVGNLAYVVTFRQTDPLFVVDLSDPTYPRLLGELHAEGFAGYLQPVGPNRLLGVGTDAGPTGMTRGALVTLYDTSDPLHPRELSRLALPDTTFQVASDPHAITWDPEVGVASLGANWGLWGRISDGGTMPPTEPVPPTNPASGIIGVSIAGDAVHEVGRISDRVEVSAEPPRTLLAAGHLWAILDRGVSAHDRANLAEQGATAW